MEADISLPQKLLRYKAFLGITTYIANHGQTVRLSLLNLERSWNEIHLWGHTESDTTEAIKQQQQQQHVFNVTKSSKSQ